MATVKVHLIRVDGGGCVSMQSDVWVDLSQKSLSRDSVQAGVDGASAAMA